MVGKDKTMNKKELTKAQKRKEKQELRKHDKSARKAFREDNPIGWRLKNLVKDLIKKNK